METFLIVLMLILLGVVYTVGWLMHFMYWVTQARTLSVRLEQSSYGACGPDGQPLRRLGLIGCYLESMFYLGTTLLGGVAFVLAVSKGMSVLAILAVLPLIDGLVRILDRNNHLPLRFLHLFGWGVLAMIQMNWISASYLFAVILWWIWRGSSVRCI